MSDRVGIRSEGFNQFSCFYQSTIPESVDERDIGGAFVDIECGGCISLGCISPDGRIKDILKCCAGTLTQKNPTHTATATIDIF